MRNVPLIKAGVCLKDTNQPDSAPVMQAPDAENHLEPHPPLSKSFLRVFTDPKLKGDLVRERRGSAVAEATECINLRRRNLRWDVQRGGGVWGRRRRGGGVC